MSSGEKPKHPTWVGGSNGLPRFAVPLEQRAAATAATVYNATLLRACGFTDVSDTWRIAPTFDSAKPDPAESVPLLNALPYAQQYLLAHAPDVARAVEATRKLFFSGFSVAAAEGLHV